MQELDLSQKQLEQAFQIVDLAWQERDGQEVELRVPSSLHHLSQDQWEQICQLLCHLLCALSQGDP